jgi:hypothetical protein
MKRAIRGLVAYLIAVVLLSSIDITYVWLWPLPPGGESTTPTEWYRSVGLGRGVVMLANHELADRGVGLSIDVHVPEFVPIPFLAAGGPEGGGVLLSVWFIALVLWCGHMLWRGGAKSKLRHHEVRD